MDGRQVQPDRWRPGRCAIARAAPEALTEGGPPRVSGRAVLPVHPAPRRSAPTPPRRCPARARTAPSTLSWRRPLVSPSPHSTVTKDTSALTERRAKPYRDVGGAGCGAAVRFGVKGAAALPGPSPRRRRCAAPRRPGGGAEADRRSPGSPRRVGGCHGRNVLGRHSMRWPRPADRDGARRLRVCVAGVPVVLGPAAGQATLAPGPGAAAAGWRARAGAVAFEVPPDDSGSSAYEI